MPAAKSKSSSHKLWIILGSVLAAIVLIAVIGWLYVKSTPQYSLYQASQTVKKHDYNAFTQYVDIDAVVDTAVDQAVTQVKAEQAAQPVSGNEFETRPDSRHQPDRILETDPTGGGQERNQEAGRER